jgi:CheY-like chemotaxis protein
MKKVLIIEDSVENMAVLSKVLNNVGLETICATEGLNGYMMALEQRPALIIIDLQLPDLEGVDLLQMIRQSEIGTSIPVIAMVSYAMSGDRPKLLDAGCNGCIDKPIDPALVIQQLKQILNPK